jgi:hypothetical protein
MVWFGANCEKEMKAGSAANMERTKASILRIAIPPLASENITAHTFLSVTVGDVIVDVWETDMRGIFGKAIATITMSDKSRLVDSIAVVESLTEVLNNMALSKKASLVSEAS